MQLKSHWRRPRLNRLTAAYKRPAESVGLGERRVGAVQAAPTLTIIRNQIKEIRNSTPAKKSTARQFSCPCMKKSRCIKTLLLGAAPPMSTPAGALMRKKFLPVGLPVTRVAFLGLPMNKGFGRLVALRKAVTGPASIFGFVGFPLTDWTKSTSNLPVVALRTTLNVWTPKG
jgi:hypothetical protein